MTFGVLRYLLNTAAIAAAYFFAAELGLSLASVHTNVSPVWPPTGIAIATVLVLGRRYWPAIFLGAFAANFSTHVGVFPSLGIATGNTLEAVGAALLLEYWGGFRKSLDSVASVIKFIVLAGIIAPVISATLGNLSLCLSGAAVWADFGKLWITWWLGDGVGALVVSPFLVAWSIRQPFNPEPGELIEGIALLALLFITSMVVLNGWFPGQGQNYPLAHLGLPFLVWAALRFGQRLLTSAIVLLAGIAVWGTANGFGPFVQSDPNKSLLLLQAYVASNTLTTLILFAVISERRSVRQENETLTGEVTKQRKRLSNIVAHVPGVVWEAWGRPDAANQQIDFVSEYVEQMLGYKQEEWLSQPNFWLTVVHPDDKLRAAEEAAEIFASGRGGVSRFRWLTKDGREIWVEAQSVVVCDESGCPIGMRGVTMDITQAVLAEQERAHLLESERHARTEAEKASRLKDEFLATLSHELRTPLNAIVGWSRLVNSNQLHGDELLHAAKVIERNACAQKQIIEDLLDVSRIITGKLRLRLAPVRLAQIINEAIDGIRPAAQAKEIEIRTRLEAPEVIITGDPDRLQQIAWNLLSNAVKFTPSGGTIDIAVGAHNGNAEVVVSDTGPGIEPDFLPHVFERFTQADSSSTRRHGGLGLGLAIVRHLVELHGGSVKAENTASSGASFTVIIPPISPTS